MSDIKSPAALLADSVESLVRDGAKAVTIDAPIGLGSVPVVVAGRIAKDRRPVLLVVGNRQVATQAREMLERVDGLRVGGVEDLCHVALVTWGEIARHDMESLAATYGVFVLGERYPDHADQMLRLSKILMAKSGVQVVDHRGSVPRVDLGGAVVKMQANGSIVVTRPEQDPVETLVEVLKGMDDGRKDYFILVDRKVETATLSEMMAWVLRNGGISVQVGDTELGTGLRISTAFVAGLRRRNIGPFETYIEGATVEANYWTWDEAVEGHDLQIYRRGPAR